MINANTLMDLQIAHDTAVRKIARQRRRIAKTPSKANRRRVAEAEGSYRVAADALDAGFAALLRAAT